jgi:hypothetical protein
MNHEDSFVNAFIIPEKRSRFLQLLANPKRRREILDRFNHHLDYDDSLATAVTASQHSSEQLEKLLRAKGATDICHIIADQSNLDGQDVALGEAIDSLYCHDFAVVISCILGRLAYFKPESPSHGFIFEKKS